MVSAVYNRAIKNEKLTENPVRGTSQRKLRNNVIRWLRAEQEKAIRGAIQGRIDKAEEDGHLLQANHERHCLCEFVVSLQTGMRRGEQYGLTVPDVDLKHKQIHVKESKNGTERYIPMLPEFIWAFKQLKAMRLRRKSRAVGQPDATQECLVQRAAETRRAKRF